MVMTMNSTPWPITHNAEQQRFEVRAEGWLCRLDYQMHDEGKVAHFVHTEVALAVEGRGIAAALVRAALEWAQAQNLKVVPRCSFVQSYIKRHPQWAQLVA